MLEGARHKVGMALTRKVFGAQPGMRRLMLDASTVEDPYPFYDELHAQGPVVQERTATLAVGFEAVQEALRDPLLGHPDPDRPKSRLERLMVPDHYRGLVHPITPPSMISLNPPDHSRYRKLVSRAFTARAVEALRPAVQGVAHELLDKAEGSDSFDVMTDYAGVLPVIVIADVLGVPRADQERFRVWGYDVARTLDVAMTWPEVQAARSSLRKLNDYFDDAFEQRRRSPREDLLTALLQAEVDGDRLSRDELLATALLLLVAGFETTVNLIGNGAVALSTHPDRLADVRSRGDAGWSTAVEEVLRFDAPVQMTARVALAETQVGGLAVRKGLPVMLVLGASNRDPLRVPDPHVFDPGRASIEHNSFGGGPHFCLGAALSRIEGAVALKALFERRPDLQLGAGTRRTSPTLRGYRTLPARPAGVGSLR